ncbi:MAG: hypothetical protein AB8G23_23400 [Myxococcota bacterium]
MRQHVHRFRLLAVIAIFGIGLSAFACVSREDSDPLQGVRALSVDGVALARLLDRGAALEGTPLARSARQLRQRLASCDEVWAHFNVDALDLGLDRAEAIGCVPSQEEIDELAQAARRLRGEHAGLLLWPIGADGRIELRFDVDSDGSLKVEGLAKPPSEANALRLLIPSDEPPAAPVLAQSEALLYARARPAGGLALSKLIPSGSQGDRLFALKGRLLEGALLDGTWEFAFMPPAEDSALPLAALALHHRLAGPVREALGEALNQLENTWPIERTARSFTNATGRQFEGGCYLDLPLLPGLAPCWVVTDEALLIGYRDLALEAALRGIGASSNTRVVANAGSASEFGGLEVDLAALTASAAQPDTRPLNLGLDGETDASPSTNSAPPQPGDLYSNLELAFRPAESGKIALRGELKAVR